jgi:formate/nitrite transporter FocA (FNT family)
VGAHVIHEAIKREGEEELERPASGLFWSGLAAGLSMGFSLAAAGLLHAHLPYTAWRPLVTHLGYTVGFLVVILGRQQLFTENTLTPVLPLLAGTGAGTLGRVARLWAVVLAANLLGTLAFAAGAAFSGVFDEATHAAFRTLSWEQVGEGFLSLPAPPRDLRRLDRRAARLDARPLHRPAAGGDRCDELPDRARRLRAHHRGGGGRVLPGGHG